MLSFDISDRQINVVKGDNSANKIRIEKSLVLQVPEDMILNGEVINLSGLSDLIVTNLKAEQMMDKDAIVTFSSSNIVFKELIVPKAKGNEFLTMVQNQMCQEMGITDEYSISYTVVGEAGEDNPGAVKVLATACPSSIVESFRKLFNIMSVSLKSVNIGCNSISRIVLADKSNAEKMPLLVCQLDNNFLGLTLFENGQMAFARYVPISAEDYESDDYLMEALNENIFRMEQFNKARGGTGLENIILYGQIDDYIKIVDALDGLEIKASVLGVPSQITGFENFEFTVFANAIGALYKRNKATERINLLEVDQSTGKGGSGVSSMLITGLIVAAASIVVIGAGTLFINMRTSSVEDDIAAVNADIEKANEKLEANKVFKDQLTYLKNYDTYINSTYDTLNQYPQLDDARFKAFDAVFAKHDASYGGIDYDRETGVITFSNVIVKKGSSDNLGIAVTDFAGDFNPDKEEADPEIVKYVAAVNFAGYSVDTSEDTNNAVAAKLDGLSITLKEAGEE